MHQQEKQKQSVGSSKFSFYFWLINSIEKKNFIYNFERKNNNELLGRQLIFDLCKVIYCI